MRAASCRSSANGFSQTTWRPASQASITNAACVSGGVAIVTAHSGIDYADVVRRGKVIVDFRNATKGYEVDGKVWKL